MRRPGPLLFLAASLSALLASVVAAEGRSASGGASPPRLERLAYPSSSGGERGALLYLPAGYDDEPDRRWPLMLFLHGDGERGDGLDDLDWVQTHGPLYEAWVQKRDLPFVIVAPQLDLFGREETVSYIRDRDPSSIPRRLEKGVPPRPAPFPTPEPMDGATSELAADLPPEGPPDGWFRREDDLLTLLDRTLEETRTDPERVVLTGLSYGGFGTWHLASRHPERFAAIAPVAGFGHPEQAPALAAAGLPIWAFAGGRDPVVRVRHFYPVLNELERLGHDEVRFTVHEDVGHDVWVRVYAGRDLYDWLLEKIRRATE